MAEMETELIVEREREIGEAEGGRRRMMMRTVVIMELRCSAEIYSRLHAPFSKFSRASICLNSLKLCDKFKGFIYVF